MDLAKNFKQLVDKNQLVHGYLLYGPSPEKLAFAQSLANYFEHKQWVLPQGILLDAKFVDGANPSERPKEQKSEEVGIDEMRDIKYFLWQKPVASPKRLLVVNRADMLTPQAQNAILKITEEPPAHALIVLTVVEPEVLLPTVVSRFQKIYFGGDPGAAAEDIQLAKDFLKAGPAKQKEWLKEIVDDNRLLEGFAFGLLQELRRDRIRNYKAIRELLHRWTLINQFNVNKRLQLEAVLAQII